MTVSCNSSLCTILKVLMSEVIITPKIDDNNHSRPMYGGIKNRAFSTAALAVASTATNFLAFAMTFGFFKQRTLFRRRPVDALFPPNGFTYTGY